MARLLITFSALVLIAIVSQGVHDLAIEHLGVPYPTLVNAPTWLGAAGDVGRVLALTVFYLVAGPPLQRRNTLVACLIVGALECFLSERFRVSVIEFFITEAWRGREWLYMLTGLIPWLAVGFAQGAGAVLIGRRLAAKGVVATVGGAVLAAVAIRFGVAPLTEHLASFLNAASGIPEPQTFHTPPYSGVVLLIIYLSFIEPTAAAFFMAKLAWPALPGRAGRTGWFVLLMLGCTGRLTSLLLGTFWVRQPLVVALASTGQFAAETAVMAVLVVWLASRRDPRKMRS